jgi:hypothetical protein
MSTFEYILVAPDLTIMGKKTFAKELKYLQFQAAKYG